MGEMGSKEEFSGCGGVSIGVVERYGQRFNLTLFQNRISHPLNIF